MPQYRTYFRRDESLVIVVTDDNRTVIEPGTTEDRSTAQRPTLGLPQLAFKRPTPKSHRLVLENLRPITELRSQDFMIQYMKIVGAHARLYQSVGPHGDISLNHLQHRNGVGILTDFELAPKEIVPPEMYAVFARMFSGFKFARGENIAGLPVGTSSSRRSRFEFVEIGDLLKTDDSEEVDFGGLGLGGTIGPAPELD